MLSDQTGVLIVCVVLGYFSDCGGAVRISECSQAGWMEIGEDDGQSANITCVDIPANQTVRWQVLIRTAFTGIARCGPLRNCTHRGADLAVSRPSDTSSVLTIVDNLRTKVGNGSVSCTAVNLQPNEYFSCKTNVITPAPPLSPCNLEVKVTDWTVAGTCRFEHAFSSNGTYTCTWRQHHNQSLPDRTMAGVVEKTEQRLSNKTYYSGTCSFTSLLTTTVSEGEYSYSVHFYPGSGTATVGTLTVDRPGQPRANCSQYVYEGQDVLCHCLPNASTPGSPRPALQWHGHNADSPLDLRDVRRDRSGHVFVCTLLWGPPSDRLTKHVNYTLEVAYGPDDVTVTRRQDGQTVESQFLTLVCTVTGVYPSAVVTWTGVNCSSAPDSTGETDDNVCRIRPAQDNDGKVVTCVASNSVFPDHLVRNATYQIVVQAPAKPGPAGGNVGGDDQALGPIVGGTVAAVAVVVVVVLVVVIVKRQRRKKPADTRQLENRTENDAPYSLPRNPQPIRSTSTDESAVSSRTDEVSTTGPYDSLVVSDIGLKSEYSQLGHHGNGLESSKSQYENLQMSDVGLASPYSETDHQGNSFVANSDGVYYNT